MVRALMLEPLSMCKKTASTSSGACQSLSTQHHDTTAYALHMLTKAQIVKPEHGSWLNTWSSAEIGMAASAARRSSLRRFFARSSVMRRSRYLYSSRSNPSRSLDLSSSACRASNVRQPCYRSDGCETMTIPSNGVLLTDTNNKCM